MKCANCNTELDQINTKNGFYYSCKSCDGKMVSIPVLKREHIDPDILRQIHSKKQDSPTDYSKKCPQCQRAMKQLSIMLDSKTMELEFCQQCFCIWFDTAEHENIPKNHDQKPLTPILHPDSIKAMAMADVEILRIQREQLEREEKSRTDQVWFALRLFGL
jgi:Zn-finger nucleic acid-binding protein/DNA-directed RNA polymerase subunit RPC12/RpoP